MKYFSYYEFEITLKKTKINETALHDSRQSHEKKEINKKEFPF